MELQSILFWVFSLLGVAGGIGLILNRNPVHAALSLILNFFSIAGLYLSLQAEFLAVIQILVYAGAIMVLFLFVIMLLNLTKEAPEGPFTFARVAAWVLGLAFVAEMIVVLKNALGDTGGELPEKFAGATVEAVGAAMMTKYIFPFEMISVVLIASLVGAIVVAKRYGYENEN
ncbi:MAG: NADH-quinone oxidoreductase subunit J [Bacteroidetes bacterium]|nr:NADH-quinone oxidoreductase subunit J [Bacteroidota bacterium]